MEGLRSFLSVLLLLPLRLSIAAAQRCAVQEFLLCHDLCDLAISSEVVKGVYFTGLLANLACLPPGIQVESIPIFFLYNTS
jgi:hypothetical protein